MPDRFPPPADDELERVPPRPPLNDTRLPPMLRVIQRGLGINVQDSMRELASGEIDVDEWQAAVEAALGTHHVAAYLAAGGAISTEASDAIASALARQFQFLENFKLVIQNSEEFERGWNARLEQYARSVTVSFRNGEVAFRADGRILPLPAMPAEGTICGSACGCNWDVQALGDNDEGDYNCYWRLGKEDNCATCLARTAAWSPLRIRGGALQV